MLTMPKEKEKLSEFLARVSGMYSGVLRTDGSILFCVYCNTKINNTRLFNVKQHMCSTKHKDALKRRETQNESEQALLRNCRESSINPFHMEICKAFVEANIPLKKISHPSIKQFMNKYTKNEMPSESSVRKYVPMLYEEKIKELRVKAENKHIWTSLDETTDTEQRYIANFIFGILDGTHEEKNKCYLLNIAQLEEVNASTIAAFYADSLQLLWPSGIQYNKVLLVVTDAASYMLSAMSALKVLYPKMLHLTCFAHGLHRIAEFVRSEFTLVNKLISTTKAVFVKVTIILHNVFTCVHL